MPTWTCKVKFGEENKLKTIQYIDMRSVPVKEILAVDPLLESVVMRFNDWLSNDRYVDGADLALLGRILYNMIFPPGSARLSTFEADYRFFMKNKTTDSRLRLVLEFDPNAADLANYPWEFLFMPPTLREESDKVPTLGSFFLAGQQTELILTRFVPDVKPKLEQTRNELRILLVESSPRPLNTIEAKEVVQIMEELNQHTGIEVETLKNPTYDQLQAAFAEINATTGQAQKPIHILHFIGHGDPGKLYIFRKKEEIEEEFKLTGVYNDILECTANDLINLFNDRPPRLIFLHACNGAKPESLEGFTDLARMLVYAKAPAVVAMRYKITNKDAATFTKTFYETLSKGAPIDEAVRAGREELGKPNPQASKPTWSDRRFGTPVVYLQSEDPIVFPQEVQPEPEPVVVANKEPCPNPDCTGMVRQGAAICIKCKHALQICPKCTRVMSATLGICECGFGIEMPGAGQASLRSEASTGAAGAAVRKETPTAHSGFDPNTG